MLEAELERNPLLDRSAAAEGEAARSEANAAAAPDGPTRSWGSPGWQRDGEPNGATKKKESAADHFDDTSAGDDADPGRRREPPRRRPAISEWAGVGLGGRDGSDFYNLEAFVTAGRRCADWLREQLTLARRRPGAALASRAIFGSIWSTRRGYPRPPTLPRSPKARHQRRRARSGARDPAGFRSARRFAPATSPRMPCHPALGERNRFDPAMARRSSRGWICWPGAMSRSA